MSTLNTPFTNNIVFTHLIDDANNVPCIGVFTINFNGNIGWRIENGKLVFKDIV